MNSFGKKFRVSIFGESHGLAVGVVLDGVPAGLPLQEADFSEDLERRRPGAVGTTARHEKDQPQFVSGLLEGYTTGAPLTILFANENIHSGDYANLIDHPRPGHADFVASQKWSGSADPRGGGHFSGRLTVGLVAAGVVAKKVLAAQNDVTIKADIVEIGGESDPSKREALIRQAIQEQDSLGGIVECTVWGLPVGWGEPFFDSVESQLSHVLFSIPAVKGLEFGAGFAGVRMRGSQHNDPIVDACGTTATNHNGGINGGLTNGNPVVFRVAVKPTPSIAQKQETYNFQSQRIETLSVHGRHDACIAQRVPVVVEAVAALVFCDISLQVTKK